jgi:hypothetical protein
VISSGGEAKDDKTIPKEVRGIGQRGGFGSIRCRNSVQRPWVQGIRLLDQIMDIRGGGKMLAGVGWRGGTAALLRAGVLLSPTLARAATQRLRVIRLASLAQDASRQPSWDCEGQSPTHEPAR